MMLAAGRGTRLGELGRQIPKALVEIDGCPLLERQLSYLAREGVEHVVMNAHHLAEQIVAYVEARTGPPYVEVVIEPELLGTAGGVRGTLDRFDRGEPLFVVYADTILHARLHDVMASHVAAGADGTLCGNWLDNTRGKGVFETDPEGIIRSFIEKPADERPGLASTGLYVLEHELVEMIPAGEFYDFGIDLFPRALAAGCRLQAYRLDALARDIGTPEALAEAQAAIMRTAMPTIQASRSV